MLFFRFFGLQGQKNHKSKYWISKPGEQLGPRYRLFLILSPSEGHLNLKIYQIGQRNVTKPLVEFQGLGSPGTCFFFDLSSGSIRKNTLKIRFLAFPPFLEVLEDFAWTFLKARVRAFPMQQRSTQNLFSTPRTSTFKNFLQKQFFFQIGGKVKKNVQKKPGKSSVELFSPT